MATNSGLWTLSEMVPKIVATNAELEVHGMARYFEDVHRDDSVEVVRFLRKFAEGTQVRDVRQLGDRWPELSKLDAARTIARKAKDQRESDRISNEFAKIGIALKDSRDPKTGEITTTWQVAR